MKYSAALSVLVLAATATTAPADIEARTGGGGGGNKACNANSGKQVCCNGLLNCLVQVLGDTCNTKGLLLQHRGPRGHSGQHCPSQLRLDSLTWPGFIDSRTRGSRCDGFGGERGERARGRRVSRLSEFEQESEGPEFLLRII